MSLPEWCQTHTLKEFLTMMKDAEHLMDVLDGPEQKCEPLCEDEGCPHHGTPHVCINDNLDPIQNNCKYGYVLPDRCRYNPKLGCDCGAYPSKTWDGEKYT